MITSYKETHTQAILDIWQEGNLQAHPSIPAQYWLDNRIIVETQYLPQAETFVYEENGTARAFISIIDGSFIGALFVALDSQGQGIGRKLLDHCKNLYSTLELAVYKENSRALKFYRNNHFNIRLEQNNPDSGYTEYLMAWP